LKTAVIDHDPPLVAATIPTMVQPGGGLCFGLEATWGRFRRAWLRRVHPGYVRRMAEQRQGECTGCTHDVIDSRDLKLVRNVCGYWFRPEDDRFRWRDRIPLARYGLAEVLFSSACCGPVFVLILLAALRTGNLGLWALTAVLGWLWFQLVWFFRDPTRSSPRDPDAMVSPAVLNARHQDCVRRNEQLWLDYVEPNGRMIRVKQFSGALARRLVCHVKLGEEIQVGERYGIIKYGSRADVLVPTGEDMTWTVKVGDVVGAGTSVLARFGARGR
jgi:phosphatidylserine decarboxylase